MSTKSSGAKISVRMPQEIKAQLEQSAAKEGFPDLASYLRAHLPELQSKGLVRVEEDVMIPYQHPYSVPAMSPLAYYPQQHSPYSPYAPHVPDAMDAMFNDMRKLVTVKIMADMLKGFSTPDDFVRSMQGQKRNDGDFDMGTYLKYSMIQAENDRRMANYQMQLEMARSKGDTKGEKGALDAIAALMTANSQAQIAQATQAQQFLQQFMVTSQANSQQQNQLFTTALQVQKQGEIENRSQAQTFQEQIGGLQTQVHQGQIDTLTKVTELQMQQLNNQVEQIRNEKAKDPLTQIAALLELREKSPVYKAAFDAAFGVKEESMIGTLIPKLKELGVDKLIEKVAATLGNIVLKPKIPSPEIMPTIPSPTPITPTAMCPHGIPYGQICPQCQTMQQTIQPQQNIPLEQLKLPITKPQQTKTPTNPFEVKPEDAIGYTNLTPREEIIQVTTSQPEVTISLPQEETITIPQPPQPQQPWGEIPPEQQKPFTTHKGGKPK